MDNGNTWWDTLAPRSRRMLLACASAIVLGCAAAGWWLLRGDPAVLFTDLRPQDAAAMATELEKLKVPYAVADNGATLMVDRSQVHAVRLKLMGRDMPLHGTVGLELFNTSDFGMTEFAQKINFQRALQGELTRTILSFPEVRDARVHIALAEQGLFRQNAARAKAAVTLTLRSGQSLRPEQVHGVQRLVAAAVPGLVPEEVTIVDPQGVALSRGSPGEEVGGGGVRLELKRETETYLARKADAVLEKAFGPGQALASVDVVLNMDQVRVTTEDIVAAPDAKGMPTGVLVRERESARDSAAPDARPGDARGAHGSSMQRDVEYQTGRRVEHVVSQPGAIRRIQVVAVVRQELVEAQREQVQRLLAASVGASSDRGDTVVVQTLLAARAEAAPAAVDLPRAHPQGAVSAPADQAWWPIAFLALSFVGVLAWVFRKRTHAVLTVPALTDSQRRAALERVQGWMLEETDSRSESVRPRTEGLK